MAVSAARSARPAVTRQIPSAQALRVSRRDAGQAIVDSLCLLTRCPQARGEVNHGVTSSDTS